MPRSYNPFVWLDNFLRLVWKSLSRPTPRGKLWLIIIVIFLLLCGSAVFDYPHGYNKVAEKINAGLHRVPYLEKINIPKIYESSYRLGLDLLGGSHLIYEADMSSVAPDARKDALSGVRDVVERRVNAFGISEPIVQTATPGGKYRVIIELAGIKDIGDAIKQIGETPILEFKEQSDTPTRELSQEEQAELVKYNEKATDRANEALVKALAPNVDFSALAKEYSEDTGSRENGGDLGCFSQGAMVQSFEDAVFNEKLEVGQTIKTLVVSEFGYHIIKKTDEKPKPDGTKEVCASHILIRTKSSKDFISFEEGWKPSGLSGKQLEKARVAFDPQTSAPQVSLDFNSEGKNLFADLTEKNIGKPIAIFLDGYIISAPRVSERISGGSAVISGNFSLQEAKLLAQRLNAGALPVPIKLVSQTTVGATLGQLSLQKSLFAGLIGFLAVAVFMLLFYRLPGFLATLSLIIYSAITLAIFKLVGVTLTLAGIAGFILSIGMAVDANILIFERLKEELRKGLPRDTATNEGFRRAWNSIRDSNISSLITCAILAWLGTSVIRGFAITLALGILISMFSAITISRTLLKLVGPWFKSNWWFGVKR